MLFWKHLRMYFGCIVLMIMVTNGVQAWTYHYNTDSMKWNNARAWCKLHYTDMVAIQNKEEIMYLNQLLPQHKSYYWIGLRKIADQWTWVGTMKPLAPEAVNWAIGEPNDRGTSEDCVEIYIKRSVDTGKWNDDKCDKKKAALCYTASCVERSCSEHAVCVENIGNYSCKCNAGFTGSRCSKGVECGMLERPKQGFVQCNHVYGDFRFNSSCHFQCAHGFMLHGSHHLHCLSSGKWDSNPPECQVVECPPITTLTSGWNMTCDHPLGTNSYNSTCEFSCEEGFDLRGSHTTLCDHTGQWTHNTPDCTAVTCEPVLSPYKGHMTCNDLLGTFSFGSSCAVGCEEGYTLRGENTLTCLKSGKWSAETPVCDARQCSTLSKPENGWMDCSHPHSLFSYGSRCRLGCEIGYVLRGESKLNCTTDGTWSQEIPYICTVVQCKSLFPALLSRLDSTPVPVNNCSHPRGNFSFGSKCVFSCPEGYRLNGTTHLICTFVGLWTDRLPTCIMQSMPLGSAFLLYSAVGAASALGLLLLGGLFMLLVWQFSKNKVSPDFSAWDGTLNPVFEEN